MLCHKGPGELCFVRYVRKTVAGTGKQHHSIQYLRKTNSYYYEFQDDTGECAMVELFIYLSYPINRYCQHYTSRTMLTSLIMCDVNKLTLLLPSTRIRGQLTG